MENFDQKSFRKGFSCKPTWMWASITDDTRKSSFWAVDYFFLGQALFKLKLNSNSIIKCFGYPESNSWVSAFNLSINSVVNLVFFDGAGPVATANYAAITAAIDPS